MLDICGYRQRDAVRQNNAMKIVQIPAKAHFSKFLSKIENILLRLKNIPDAQIAFQIQNLCASTCLLFYIIRCFSQRPFVVQSESSDGENGAIWMIGEKRQIGVCPVTSVGECYFVLYLLGIYTTKKQGMIE